MIKLLLTLLITLVPVKYKEPTVKVLAGGEHRLINPRSFDIYMKLDCGPDSENVVIKVPKKSEILVRIVDVKGDNGYCQLVDH